MKPHPIPEPALDKATAFVGATGSGKTFTAKSGVECLLDMMRRVCVVDPTGVWWGLRTAADGKRPGYSVVIFGGDHADVPIAVEDGERLGELVASGKVPASIVDVSEMSGNQQTRFLTDFAEALYAKNREALHLIIDEADAAAPQSPMPEGRRLLGAIDKIARRGRVKGFRLWTITQRPAVLHKNVLSQVSTLVALGLRSPQDRKAIEAWVQGNANADQAREVLDSLPKLKVGEGWVWSPAEHVLERVQFPRIRTFDSSRTPGPGEILTEAKSFAKVDVGALRVAFAPAPANPTEAGETDPVSAKKLGRRSTPRPEPIDIEQRGYDRGYADGLRTGLTRGFAEARRAIAEAQRVATIGEVAKRNGAPMSSAERSRKFRERQRNAKRAGDATTSRGTARS